jgi:hypothetical protein
MSETGTRVNGKDAEAVALKHGDLIQVGNVSMTFLTEGEGAAAARPSPDQAVLPLIDDPWEVWRDQPSFALPKAKAPAPESTSANEEQVEGAGLRSKWHEWRAKASARGMARDALRANRRLERESKRRQADLEERRREAEERLAIEAEWQKRFDEGRRNLEHESFRDLLVHQLKNSPFLLISLAFHVVLAILLSLSTVAPRERTRIPLFEAVLDSPQPELQPEFREDTELTDKQPDVVDTQKEDIIEPDVPKPLPDAATEHFDDTETPRDTPSEFRPGDSVTGLAEGLGLKLGGNRGLKLGGTQFRKYVQTLRKQGFEVVVVIDSTGSMGSVLADTRKEVDRILLTLGTLIPNFRLGVVTYRDANEDNVTKGAPLTNAWYKAVAFLDDIKGGGGGDSPEAVLEGLEHAINKMQWTKGSKKVVLLVGDAPYHDRDKKELESLLRTFAKSGGVVHTLTTGNQGRQLMQTLQGAFQQVARWASGTCTNLQDSDELSKVLLTLAIGDNHKSDVVSVMQTLESSPEQVRAARLANTGSAEEVLEALKGNQSDPLLLRELVKANRLENIPAYLLALSDSGVSLSTRWAVTVILRRTLLLSEGNRSMYEDALRLNPDHSIERNQGAINALRSGWNSSASRKNR